MDKTKEDKYYIITDNYYNWYSTLNQDMVDNILDNLRYADYAKDLIAEYFVRLNRVPTYNEVVDLYIEHEAAMGEIIFKDLVDIKAARIFLSNVEREQPKNFMEWEYEMVALTKRELISMLEDFYGLNDFVARVIDEVESTLSIYTESTLKENTEEWLSKNLPEFDKLTGWEEGWVVGISAFKGEDFKLDTTNNKLLAEELVKLGLDFIGPNESVWDGVSEEGFLVNVHSQNNLNKLYELGIRFNQDWVAVWEAPIIIGTEIKPVAATDNHTKLDKHPLTIIKDDVSKYVEFKNKNLNEKTNLKENNDMNETKDRITQGFTLDVNGEFHLIKKPQDLYDLYNDWLIDHNDGIHILAEEELQIVEEIRDSYNTYYNIMVSNGIRYIKLDDFELYAKEELGLAISNIDLIEEINPNVIIQTVDLDELKKAIRNRRKGGEDGSGSGGLWDFAFETTLSYIWQELGIDGFTNEEHYAYQRLAEEVYNILVMNEDNYVRGKRPELNESIKLVDEITFISEMRYRDYVIEFFKDTQYGQYYWQAEYDGNDRKLSNFNIWITTRGISLSYQDNEGYPTKANVISKAMEWVDKQKRRWDDSLTEAADFYGATQGSEKADDILFALQVMYGEPKYDYEDFMKMNLPQSKIKEALAYVKKKGYNKFSFFDSLTEDAFDYNTMHKISDYLDIIEDKRMSAKQIFDFVKKQFPSISNTKIAESLEYIYSGSRLNFAQFAKDSLTEDADFYGASQGSEKADDVLFALQVMYGEQKYTYSDFQKMNLSQTEINSALAYVKKKGYNKFTYWGDDITAKLIPKYKLRESKATKKAINEATEALNLLYVTDANEARYDLFPLHEHDPAIAAEGSTTRNAKVGWGEALAEFLNGLSYEKPGGWLAQQLFEMKKEEFGYASVEEAEDDLYNTPINEYLTADEMISIVEKDGYFVYEMKGYSKGDHYGIVSEERLSDDYLEELEAVVFGGDWYNFHYVKATVVERKDGESNAEVTIEDTLDSYGPAFLHQPYNKHKEAIFERYLDYILSYHGGEKNLDGIIVVNTDNYLDDEINQFFLDNTDLQFYTESKHTPVTESKDKKEIDETDKYYYSLIFDFVDTAEHYYNETPGDITEDELIEEVLNQMEETGVLLAYIDVSGIYAIFTKKQINDLINLNEYMREYKAVAWNGDVVETWLAEESAYEVEAPTQKDIDRSRELTIKVLDTLHKDKKEAKLNEKALKENIDTMIFITDKKTLTENKGEIKLIDVLSITEDEANIIEAESGAELVSYDNERKLAVFKGSLGALTNVALIDFYSETSGEFYGVNGDTKWFVDDFLDAQHKEIEIEFDDYYLEDWDEDEEEIFELYKTKLGVNVKQLGEPYGPYLFYANTLGEIVAFIAVHNGDLELSLPKLSLSKFINKINRIYKLRENTEELFESKSKLNEKVLKESLDTAIFITDIEDYDELHEIVRDRLIDEHGSLDNAMEELGYTFDDEMIYDELDATFYNYIEKITRPESLKQYWLENGWTLDRGYGGPNYKERLANSTNWDLLYDVIQNVKPVDEMFNAILLTPVELNDLVIFSGDCDEEDKLNESKKLSEANENNMEKINKMKKRLVELLKEIYSIGYEIENMEVEDEGNHILNLLGKEATKLYPFGLSFDEFRFSLGEYIEVIEKEIENVCVDFTRNELNQHGNHTISELDPALWAEYKKDADRYGVKLITSPRKDELYKVVGLRQNLIDYFENCWTEASGQEAIKYIEEEKVFLNEDLNLPQTTLKQGPLGYYSIGDIVEYVKRAGVYVQSVYFNGFVFLKSQAHIVEQIMKNSDLILGISQAGLEDENPAVYTFAFCNVYTD